MEVIPPSRNSLHPKGQALGRNQIPRVEQGILSLEPRHRTPGSRLVLQPRGVRVLRVNDSVRFILVLLSLDDSHDYFGVLWPNVYLVIDCCIGLDLHAFAV